MRKLLAALSLIALMFVLSGCYWRYSVGYGFGCGPSISFGALDDDWGPSHRGWGGHRGRGCR